MLEKYFGNRVDYDIPVICVPSRLCVAITNSNKRRGFYIYKLRHLVSFGTELDEPIINDDVLNAFNEVGAFDKITLLKNSIGMLFSNLRVRTRNNEQISWDEFDLLANDHMDRFLF